METLLYAVCLGVGLIFTIISAVAGHFFGGGDAHADVGTGEHAEAGFDHTGMPGISFFSPTVLASFVTAFGAFGLIFTRIQAAGLGATMPLEGGPVAPRAAGSKDGAEAAHGVHGPPFAFRTTEQETLRLHGHGLLQR